MPKQTTPSRRSRKRPPSSTALTIPGQHPPAALALTFEPEAFDAFDVYAAIARHPLARDLRACMLGQDVQSAHTWGLSSVHNGQGWYRLELVQRWLHIKTDPPGLYPLPVMRPLLSPEDTPHAWVDRDAYMVPWVMVLTRLAPYSPLPMAQLVTLWLQQVVLPTLKAHGGPETLAELEKMIFFEAPEHEKTKAWKRRSRQERKAST